MTIFNANANPIVHVRFDGRSWDIPLELLRLGSAPSDSDVRMALARHLETPVTALTSYIVERHANGNLTVRPEAVFG